MADKDLFPDVVCTASAVIASSGSLSEAVDLGGASLVGIQMPDSSAWTAANLTFQASADGGTFENLYGKNGNEVTVIAAADRYIQIDATDFAGIKHIKVRSGTAASAVNQAAARTLTLVLRPV